MEMAGAAGADWLLTNAQQIRLYHALETGHHAAHSQRENRSANRARPIRAVQGPWAGSDPSFV